MIHHESHDEAPKPLPKGWHSIHIDFAKDWKPGDLPPNNMLDRWDWAMVQHQAGLVQAQCPTCGLWRYPQEECCEAKQ